MNRNRRALVAMLAVALLLVGCSSDDTTATTGGGDTPTTTSGGDAVTIKVVDVAEAHGVAMQALAPRFEADTGIKVDVEILPYDSTYETEVLTLSTGQSDIDVVVFDVIWAKQYNEGGWLLDLQPFIDDPNLPGLDLNGFVPGVIDAYHRHDGGVFGIPIDFTAQLLAYRTDLFQEAGLSGPPATWDEFAQYAEQLTKDTTGDGEIDQYGLVFHGGGADAAYSDWLTRMAGYTLPEGQSEFLLTPDLSSAAFDDYPYGVEALQRLLDVEQYAPPGSPGFDYGEAIQTFQEGSAAMYVDWQVSFGGFSNPDDSAVVGKVGYAPAPIVDQANVYAGGWQMGINAASEHAEEAYKFLSWIGSDEGQMAMIEAGSPTAYRQVAFEDQAILDANPIVAATAEALANGRTVGFPQTSKFVEMQQELFIQLQAALTGQMSAQEAVTEMAAGVDDVLSD
jgi:ABC-type glycerol-3-phosphate transport system substrate-binding protein